MINAAGQCGTASGASAGRVFVDATFGRGGHCRALLARLQSADRVVAIDRDRAAVAAGAELARTEPRLDVCQAKFSELPDVLASRGIEAVAGVVMDLGVSSPQLDDPTRGFSFRNAGPIDMRMDQSSGEMAGDWLNRAAEEEIARVISTLGEERYARRIARAIVGARPLQTTAQLADIVRGAIPARDRHKGSDPATRTFQAIRMHVNEELDEVAAGIRAAFAALSPGGRLAVISFHSLEDRLVKKTFRELTRGGRDIPRNLPVRAEEVAPIARVIAGPVRPGADELERNPRARSATLRVLERLS